MVCPLALVVPVVLAHLDVALFIRVTSVWCLLHYCYGGHWLLPQHHWLLPWHYRLLPRHHRILPWHHWLAGDGLSERDHVLHLHGLRHARCGRLLLRHHHHSRLLLLHWMHHSGLHLHHLRSILKITVNRLLDHGYLLANYRLTGHFQVTLLERFARRIVCHCQVLFESLIVY